MTQDSIYYFKGVGEFKRFIQAIDDRTLSVSEALDTFRETKKLINELKCKTVQELVDQPSLILELSNALRKGMEPKSRFKLPFKIVDRERELIQNLGENVCIDLDKAKAKIVIGHYKNDKTGQEFNYALEIAIAPFTHLDSRHAGEISIIGNINSTPSISGGADYFSGDNAYFWIDKKGRSIVSSSLQDILQECGYIRSGYITPSKQKVPSILYINLSTPCPDWLGSAGKTHINLRPYAADIAKTVSSLAYKMPSYHGTDRSRSYLDDYKPERKTARSYVEDFLNGRFDAIQTEPTLRHTDPLTQSGVWYRIRPIMLDSDFVPPKNWGKTRKYVTDLIDKLCAELFENTEREDLGIVAKARAMMIYEGHTYPVDMDSFRALGRKGIFILVIEKEGIARIVADVARDVGVALVHTGGRFTKYVKYLIEHAEVPVGILTDYDSYGMDIAKATFSKTPRIGIDMDVVDWLQKHGHPDLTLEQVQEDYVSKIKTDIEYLKKHRIELDSVEQRVGPKSFWNYIKHKIEEQQKEKGLDYTRIITEPVAEELRPRAIDDLILKLDNYIEDVVKEDWQEIEIELSESEELISVKEQQKLNLEAFTQKVAADETMQEEIIPRIKKLIEELSELLD